MRLAAVDDGQEIAAVLRDADGTARRAADADIRRKILLVDRHMDAAILHEARAAADDEVHVLPAVAEVLLDHHRVADLHAAERIGRHAVHRDDDAICRDWRIVLADIRDAAAAHDVLTAVFIRARRAAVSAVVDDEAVRAALAVDAGHTDADAAHRDRAVIRDLAEDRRAVLAQAKRRTRVVRRADRLAVDLRHAEDVARRREVRGIDAGHAAGSGNDAADGLTSRDFPFCESRHETVARGVCR